MIVISQQLVSQHIQDAQESINQCLISGQTKEKMWTNVSNSVDIILEKINHLSYSFDQIGRD